jgi:murein DD-endopeptidase MepM/ murein hydrolase activator NlpD
MRPPLNRMRLRSLYGSKPQTLHPHRSLFGHVRSGGFRVHQGWDLSAPPGTPVYAIASGNCVHVQSIDCPNQFDAHASYGKHVVLEFRDSLSTTYYAFYAHLQTTFVVTGADVREGQLLGYTGRSGRGASQLPIDQAHLHFEVPRFLRLAKDWVIMLTPLYFCHSLPQKIKT